MKWILFTILLSHCGLKLEKKEDLLPFIFPVTVKDDVKESPTCYILKNKTPVPTPNAQGVLSTDGKLTVSSNYCIEYTDYQAADLENYKGLCIGEGGNWSVKGCPHSNALFGCNSKQYNASKTTTSYTTWFYSEDDRGKFDNGYSCPEGIVAPLK